MKRFAAIAALAAMETIRSPVFLLVSFSATAGITLFPFLLHFTLGDAARMVVNSSFSLLFMCGTALAVLAVTTGIAAELRKGAAGVLLAKPVSRSLFLLAKTTGIAAALALYAGLTLAATLLATRAATPLQTDWAAAGPALAALLLASALAGLWNHRTRRSFPSAAFILLFLFYLAAIALSAFFPARDTGLAFPQNTPFYILPAGALLLLPILMAAGLAALFSIRLESTPALLLTLLLLTAGLLADYFLGGRAFFPARVLYTLLPNIQAFWLLDALDEAQPIPATYLLTAAAYAAAYLAATLLAACLLLRRKEIP